MEQSRQEMDWEALKNQNRVPHALIFLGEDNDAKVKATMELARQVDCRASGLHVVEPAGAAHMITIAAIRDIQAKTALRPMEGVSQIVVLQDAHAMKADGQNALLKILEEPPDNVYFFLLTTDLNALLSTVRSRCQNVHIHSDSVRTHHVSAKVMSQAGAYFEVALKMADSDVLDFKSDKTTQEEMLEVMVGLLRDALVLQSSPRGNERVNCIGQESLSQRIADTWSADHILDILQDIVNAKIGLEDFVNHKLVMNQLKSNLGILI